MRLLVLSLISLLKATAFGQYNLTIEQSDPVGASTPGTVYRFYIEANDPTDKLSAVFGNDEAALIFQTPEGIYNNAFNSSWNASGINPALLPVFPDLADDSYATIGLSGPAAGVPGAEDPSLVQDAYLSPTVSDYFLTGGTELNVNTLTGASWYVLATAANALPTDGRWLVAQITTAGDLSGTLNAQMFPLGVGANQIQQSWDFAGGEVIIPCDGELDECGVCNGPGVAEGTVIVQAPCPLVATIATGFASSMKTTTVSATARMRCSQHGIDDRRQLQVDCGSLGSSVYRRDCVPVLCGGQRSDRQVFSGVWQRPISIGHQDA